MTFFEKLLIYHCAPTLLGVKQANLFSCPAEDKTEFLNSMESYNRLLNGKDIYLKTLYVRENKFFIIVYRKSKLLETLNYPTVKNFLSLNGYPKYLCPVNFTEIMLDTLGKKIADSDSFPHEIGLFLGYPPNDVLEFIRHGGKNYKFCGYWKVYGNEEHARKLFKRYEKCREVLLKKSTAGLPFAQIL